MTRMSDTIKSGADDTQEQIRQLRAQLDAVLSERVEPALRSAADSITSGMRDASDTAGKLARDELAMMTRQVRDRPVTALLAAAAIGYLVAKLTR